jgi:hypothetical protein
MLTYRALHQSTPAALQLQASSSGISPEIGPAVAMNMAVIAGRQKMPKVCRH